MDSDCRQGDGSGSDAAPAAVQRKVQAKYGVVGAQSRRTESLHRRKGSGGLDSAAARFRRSIQSRESEGLIAERAGGAAARFSRKTLAGPHQDLRQSSGVERCARPSDAKTGSVGGQNPGPQLTKSDADGF